MRHNDGVPPLFQKPPPPPPAPDPRNGMVLANALDVIRAMRKRPLIRANMPWTSHAMADAVAQTGQSRDTMVRLVGEVWKRGPEGATDDELHCAIGNLPNSTVSANMARLRHVGVMIAGPDTRPTRFGKKALVNRLANLADQAVLERVLGAARAERQHPPHPPHEHAGASPAHLGAST